MNKELKEQAHKEFDEMFPDPEKGKAFCDKRVVSCFIDSLIDKTVQMTEERIVGLIKESLKTKTRYDHFPYDGLDEEPDGEYLRFDDVEEIISLITNKSDINN